MDDKKYCKFSGYCYYTGEYREYRGAANGICNLKYSVPKESPVVMHYGSYYDYHFIMKELAEEIKEQFTCLGENKVKTSPLQFQ